MEYSVNYADVVSMGIIGGSAEVTVPIEGAYAALRREEARQEKIRQARELQDKLGREEDYEVDSVILFKIQFEEDGLEYAYAAVKAGNDRWYITGARQSNQSLTFDQLADRFLGKGSTKEIWVATEWQELS